jgi:hypothetical protein
VSSLIFVLIAGLALLGCQSNSEEAGLETVFDSMQQALEQDDEDLFKRQWLAQGYQHNLVGGSGLAGADVFRQGHGRWYLKPDMQAITHHDDVLVVRTDIWSIEKDKPVDEVYAAIGPQDGKLLLFGAGEDVEEVEALVSRYLSGEPLVAADKAIPRK